MTRVLAVDPGSTRVGLAISDPDRILAQPLEVIDADEARQHIACRVLEFGITDIVVGIPYKMDGSRGPEAEKAEAFALDIEQLTGVTVHRWDERLSSVQASHAMRAAGASEKKQRGKVDMVAAAVVLQGFLETHRSSPEAFR